MDLLISIPGPLFLLLYAGTAAIVILAARWWATHDGSLAEDLPELGHLSPTALAYLRGGAPEVLRMTLFSLWSRGLIVIEDRKRFLRCVTILQAASRLPADLNPLERTILAASTRGVTPSHLMRDTALRALAESLTQADEKRLQELKLLRGPLDRSRIFLAGALAALLLALLAAVSVWLGVRHHRPVLFPAVLMLLSFIALSAAIPRGRPTRLGMELLQKARGQLASAVSDLQLGRNPKAISPALCFAVFGMSALAGSSTFEPFRKAFRAFEFADGGYAGDFGGGWGDCGDSCAGDGGGGD